MTMITRSTHRFELDTDICVDCGHSATEIEDGLIPVECPGKPTKFPSADWLRKFDDIEEPSGCPACGLIAGCCQNYPDCPGGQEKLHENGDGV
jgi:hypothetical protein